MIGAAGRLARDSRAQFVVANVGVNLLFLVRTVIALAILDYRALGLVALLQSIVLLLGVFQFGVLNGGYRLLCSADVDEAGRVNNLVYGFMAALGLFGFVCALGWLPFAASRIDGWVVMLGLVGGVASLVRNWQTNQLIVAERLGTLNAYIFWSALGSIASLALIPVDPLLGCMAPIVVNPILFVVLAWLGQKDLRPTGLETSAALVRRIFQAGFVIFLSGILLQVNALLERWYVVGALGLEALGHLTLAVMYATLFQLVPASVNAIYLPRLVKAHQRGDADATRAGLREYLLVTLAYCAVAALATVLLMRPLVWLTLPKYLDDTRYVLILLPGLILITLGGMYATVYSIVLRYTAMLIAYCIGTGALAAAFVAGVFGGAALELDMVEALRSLSLAFTAVLLFAGYLRISRADPALRFSLLRRGRRVPSPAPPFKERK